MKKLLFILSTILLFASCSSDDENSSPYLNVESESITIPYNQSATTIKIDTNEDWFITNSSDWGELSKTKGTGKATIIFTCLTNELSKNKTTTLTIKTNSSSKNITITQEKNNNLRQGDFVKIISSTTDVDIYLGNSYNHRGKIQENQIIKYNGSISKFSINLFSCSNLSINYNFGVFLYIYLKNYDPTIGLEKVKSDFKTPHFIGLYQSPTNTDKFNPENSNITQDNFSATILNNKITYTFKNFKTGNTTGWNYVLNGMLVMEFLQ